jgi:hypothetical protein
VLSALTSTVVHHIATLKDALESCILVHLLPSRWLHPQKRTVFVFPAELSLPEDAANGFCTY